MKKKVGIVTLNGYLNHGNRLQNYALEQTIISLGYDVETIVFEGDKKADHRNLLKKIHESMYKAGALQTYKKMVHSVSSKLLKNTIYKNTELKRVLLFKEFSKINLHETTPIVASEENLAELEKKYYKFVVGSDQVWNPNFQKSIKSAYLLEFARKEKSISYAASFGVSNLQNDEKNYYKAALKKFQKISVRELEGLEILDDLSIDGVHWSLDPVMLISKKTWENLASPPKKIIQDNYVLINVLGNKSKLCKKTISTLKSEGYEIIDISKSQNKFYAINPFNFLYLIKNCQHVITDSFHTAVFSYLFNKKFSIFSRGNINSRINTLSKIIGKKTPKNFSILEFQSYVPAVSNKYFKSKKQDSYDYLMRELRGV